MLHKKYVHFSLIAAGIISIVSFILLIVFPDKKELVLYWIQFGCVLLALICSVDCLRRFSDKLFFELQLGAILCFFFGLIYWVVHLTLLKSGTQTFSISDISVMGFYLFLLSGCEILNRETKTNKDRKYSYIALIAPVINLICSFILLLCYVKINFGNVLFVFSYTAVFTPLLFLSFKLLITPQKEDSKIKKMKPYVLVIFLIVVINIIWNMSNYINHGALYLFCVFTTSILLLLIVPTAFGGKTNG